MKLNEIKTDHKPDESLSDLRFLKPIEELLLGRGWQRLKGGTNIYFSYPTSTPTGAMIRLRPDRSDAETLEIEVSDSALHVHGLRQTKTVTSETESQELLDWLKTWAEQAERLVLTDEELVKAQELADELVGEMKAVVDFMHDASCDASIRIRSFDNRPYIMAANEEDNSKQIVKKLLVRAFKKHVSGKIEFLDEDSDDDHVSVTSNYWVFVKNAKHLFNQINTRQTAIAIVASHMFESEIRKIFHANVFGR
jgi:hypothetical protein